MRTIEIYETENERRSAVLALTLLRIGVGVIFVVHGWQKLNDLQGTAASFAQHGIPNPAISTYLAILGELFGGIGLALGALTPLAALGPVLVMGGAIYFVHRNNGLFAQGGGWEYPMTLLLVALYFVTHGAGPLSVDGLISRGRRRSIRRRHDVAATSHP